MTLTGWLVLAALGAGGALVLLVVALGRVSGKADERTQAEAEAMRERLAAGRPPLAGDGPDKADMALPREVAGGLAGTPPRFVRGTSIDQAVGRGRCGEAPRR